MREREPVCSTGKLRHLRGVKSFGKCMRISVMRAHHCGFRRFQVLHGSKFCLQSNPRLELSSSPRNQTSAGKVLATRAADYWQK